jgi:hypothetical protein|tara:strand:- start:737 stop:1045 length:309 start_codon:yes stop_codon:yes gene_type:complete
MSWIEEDDLRRNKHGILLRKNQVHAPVLNVGDRFFDCGNGRWATLLRIRPDEEAMGAPFEALYDGCERFAPFVGVAMHCDIGEVDQYSNNTADHLAQKECCP